MKIKTSRPSGFTLVEIMIVVATIGLLATVAIPNYVKARGNSNVAACINNLRQLDGAIQQFALEYKKGATADVTLDDCTPYLKRSLICSSGGTSVDTSYEVTKVNEVPTCIASGGGAANRHLLP